MDHILFIENVSRSDVAKGLHMYPGENSMLIQISDPTDNFPTPKYKFKEIHQFKFLDDESPSPTVPEWALISDEQAVKLAGCLLHALKNKMNVVVHCQAGICRSGAVVEVGSMLGFVPSDRNHRIPNTLVKKKLMKVLKLGLYGRDDIEL